MLHRLQARYASTAWHPTPISRLETRMYTPADSRVQYTETDDAYILCCLGAFLSPTSHASSPHTTTYQSQNVIAIFTWAREKCQNLSRIQSSCSGTYIIDLAPNRDGRVWRPHWARDISDAVCADAVLTGPIAAVKVPEPRCDAKGVRRDDVDGGGRPRAGVAGVGVGERYVDRGAVLAVKAARA